MAQKRKGRFDKYREGVDSLGRKTWRKIFPGSSAREVEKRDINDIKEELSQDIQEASDDYFLAMTSALAAHQSGDETAFKVFVGHAASIQETIESMTAFNYGLSRPLKNMELWEENYRKFKKSRNLIDEDGNPTDLHYHPLNFGKKYNLEGKARWSTTRGIKNLIEKNPERVKELLGGDKIEGFDETVEAFRENYERKIRLKGKDENPYAELFDETGDFKEELKEEVEESLHSEEDGSQEGDSQSKEKSQEPDKKTQDKDQAPQETEEKNAGENTTNSQPTQDDSEEDLEKIAKEQGFSSVKEYLEDKENREHLSRERVEDNTETKEFPVVGEGNGEGVRPQQSKTFEDRRKNTDPNDYSILRKMENQMGMSSIGNLRTTIRKRIGPFWIMVGKDSFRTTFPYFVPSSVSLQVSRFARVRIFSDKFGSSFSADLPGGFSFRGKDSTKDKSIVEELIAGVKRAREKKKQGK